MCDRYGGSIESGWICEGNDEKEETIDSHTIVLDNGIAGIVYGYYDRDDFYYLDRLDVDVSKKEELREMNVMELRQEIALKIKIFVANSNWDKIFWILNKNLENEKIN